MQKDEMAGNPQDLKESSSAGNPQVSGEYKAKAAENPQECSKCDEVKNLRNIRPYTPTEMQGFMGYLARFNTEVETVDGVGILRNFHYEDIAGEITGLEVEMTIKLLQPAQAPISGRWGGFDKKRPDGTFYKLVTYNFGQVNIPGPHKLAPVFFNRGIFAKRKPSKNTGL